MAGTVACRRCGQPVLICACVQVKGKVIRPRPPKRALVIHIHGRCGQTGWMFGMGRRKRRRR